MSVLDIAGERLERGLSVVELAAEIGVSRGVIVRLEAGKRTTPANAKKVAEYFRVQVRDLPPFAPDPAGGPATVPPWRAEADEVDRADTSELKERVR